MPLLSIGLVLVWLGVALVVELGWLGQLKQTRHEMERAASLAISNPVVEVDQRFMRIVRAVVPGYENDELLSFLRKNQSSTEVATIQQHFDQVGVSAVELLESHPARTLGVVPARLSAHGFATHAFVHAGWLHLLATSLLFLLAAPLLEERWGRPLLGGSIVLLALAGAGAFYLAHPSADRALVGGSAVAAGLAAAVAASLRDEEVDFLGWLSPLANAELIGPGWLLAAALAVYEVALWWAVQGALPHGVDTAVGYAAHAAGAALGAALALLVGLLGLEKKAQPSPVQARAGSSRKTKAERFDLERVRKLREQGDDEGAFALFEAEVRSNARNRNVVAAFWQMALERGEPDRAGPAMVQLVQEELRRNAEAIAVDLWSELAKNLPSTLLDPETLVRLAPPIGRSLGTECVVLALEQALDSSNQGLTAAIGTRISQLALELDPELAGVAAHRALRCKDLDEKQRTELEVLAAALAPDDPSLEERRKKKAAPSVFFEESDRSGFGEVGNLSDLAEPEEADRGEEATPDTAHTESDRSGFGEVDDLAGPADPVQNEAKGETAFSDVVAEPDTAGFGEVEDLNGPADPTRAELGGEPAFAALIDEPDVASFGEVEDLSGPADPSRAEFGGEPVFAALLDEPDTARFGEVEDLAGPADPSRAEQGGEPAFAALIDEPDTASFGEVEDLSGPADPGQAEKGGEPPFAALINEPDSASTAPTTELDGELPFATLIDEPDAATADEAEAPAEVVISFPDGCVTEALPRAVEAEGLRIEIAGEAPSTLTWSRLRAVSLAGVRGIGPKPVILIDLLVDGMGTAQPLSVIRLPANRFDPRALVPTANGAIDALRSLLADLLARGDVRPLPDAAGAVANPVRVFESLETYHEQVLRVAARDLA